VSVRTRDNEVKGSMSLADLKTMLKDLVTAFK